MPCLKISFFGLSNIILFLIFVHYTLMWPVKTPNDGWQGMLLYAIPQNIS
jgi:hypothetical protein